jgi:iron complex outermembrane receptor protein
MPYSFVRSFRRSVIGGVALVALLPAAALAQDASADGDAASSGDDIVVTGTLVRGIAPPGANVIGVTAAAIEETGATNVNQVLQTIPQLASFGNLQQPLANSNEVAVNRPNLRSLPGFNTSGGSSTLVLMDGHRLVGMGVTSTSPDPDIIPPGILERVEIVPDGGSAIYGSDAVAGVMNFITIKRFNGVKVYASYGIDDD